MATGTRRNSYVKGYHYGETIATGQTGEALKIPVLEAGKTITCTLIAGASTGKFQISTSSDSAIDANMGVWQDWGEGEKTGTVSDVIIGPVTGIRGVSVSGEIKIEVIY